MKPREQMTESEYEECCWQCNGSELYRGGCKSGITDFDLYPEIKVWTSTFQSKDDRGDDFEDEFDICEMCIRWALHCERTGTDLGLA